MQLKVCGMQHNIEEVAQLEPDYMGFIFYEKSPRFVQGNIPPISPSIKKTGVFVKAEMEEILQKTEVFNLQAVQLHGGENVDFCRRLKEKLPQEIEIIKVFSIKENFNFEALQAFEAYADYFLFDTKGKYKGGNGITFNWEILKEYNSSLPFFLSGGIGPQEVEAIKKLTAYFQQQKKQDLLYGLDVNSKFEEKPGLKNLKKLQKFQEKLGICGKGKP